VGQNLVLLLSFPIYPPNHRSLWSGRWSRFHLIFFARLVF